jgi:hypothetical protein
MKVQISVEFVVSVADGTDTNALCINLDYESVSIETVSGELIDAKILEHTTVDVCKVAHADAQTLLDNSCSIEVMSYEEG